MVAESEVGYPCFTEEVIIEFCREPKSKEEIKEYFGIKQDLLYKVINPIIAEGKLIYTKSIRVGNRIIHKKLVKNDSPQVPITERSLPTDEEIIEYCTTPRYYYDIINEFGFNDYTCRKLVNKLLENKKLTYTPEVVKRHRKLIKNG